MRTSSTWFVNRQSMKRSFFAALIAGVIAHGTLMILHPVCADPVLFLDWWKHTGYQLYTQGRWAGNLFMGAHGYLVVPFLSCLFQIFDCALCAALLCDIFPTKNKWMPVLIGVCIVTHPTIANWSMYYVNGGIPFLTMITFAVWVIYRAPLPIGVRVALSTLCILLDTACVQSIIGVFTTVCVIKFVLDLLTGELKTSCKLFGWNVLSGGLGCSLYLVIWKILCKVHGVTSLYGGGDSYGIKNTLVNLPGSLRKTYRIFWDYLFNDAIVHNVYWKRHVLNAVLLMVLLVSLAVFLRKRLKSGELKPANAALAICMLCVLPVAFAPFVLIVTNYNFYLMLAESYVFLLPGILILLDELGVKVPELNIGKTCAWILTICVVWTFVWSDNAGYLLLNNTYIQTKELAARLLTRIEDLDGFSYDMEVCFIGQPNHDVIWGGPYNAYELNLALFEASPGSTFSQQGVFDGVWENSDGWGLYIHHFSGVKLRYYSNGYQDRIIELAQTDAFRNSGCFPAKDSVQVIDGTVVVKLGEVDY